MREVNYDDRQHLVYARARALTPAGLTEWLHVFARHAPARRPLAVLDLGSGTGRFTPALADEFGGPVWGVEPSDHMRANAEEHAAHPGDHHLAERRRPLHRGEAGLVARAQRGPHAVPPDGDPAKGARGVVGKMSQEISHLGCDCTPAPAPPQTPGRPPCPSLTGRTFACHPPPEPRRPRDSASR